MELLGVGLAADSTLRMAYLCYHLPRHPTPDLVGWKDLIWAGRRLSGTAGSLSTSFVGCIFRRPDSLRAAPRRAVEPRYVHTGRLEKFACCAARRRGVPSPVLLVRLQSQIYFSRQNSAILGGFFPLRGSDSLHTQPCRKISGCGLWPLSGPVTASQSWRVRSALSLRAAYSGLVVLVCRAHLGASGAQQGGWSSGTTNKAVSNEEATLWA